MGWNPDDPEFAHRKSHGSWRNSSKWIAISGLSAGVEVQETVDNIAEAVAGPTKKGTPKVAPRSGASRLFPSRSRKPAALSEVTSAIPWSPKATKPPKEPQSSTSPPQNNTI